jgi:hypothetical protein
VAYSYYIASTDFFYGDPRGKETLVRLFNREAVRHLVGRPAGRYDGVSLMPDGKLRFMIGCDGKGTGKVWDTP